MIFKQTIKSLYQTIKLGSQTIPCYKADHLNEDHYQKAIQSPKFIQWTQNFNDSNIQIKSMKILLVYFFGQNNIGFINCEVDAYQTVNQITKKIPGYVFIRGPAVAILLLVNGKLALTKQYRLPLGRYTLECPAGMMDESSNFIGQAALELEEECGIKINTHDMIDLGKVVTSGGACDEFLQLYAVEKSIPKEQEQKMLQEVYGDGNELIKIVLQEFNWDNILKTEDCKLICAAAAYQNLKK